MAVITNGDNFSSSFSPVSKLPITPRAVISHEELPTRGSGGEPQVFSCRVKEGWEGRKGGEKGGTVSERAPTGGRGGGSVVRGGGE